MYVFSVLGGHLLSVMMCLHCSDTTRAVYQRKLQRWLQYGPSTSTNMLESSVEVKPPHVDIATTRSKMVAVDEESYVDISLNNNVNAGLTASSTELKSSVDEAAVVGRQQKQKQQAASPARMSKSEVIPQVQPYNLTPHVECGSQSLNESVPQVRPYSLTNAECGSQSLNESISGWFDNDQLTKQTSDKSKAKSIATDDQPHVTAG